MYRRFIRRFREDCRRRGKVPEEQLRRDTVERWAARSIHATRTGAACATRIALTALWAWSWGLKACGYAIPPWTSPSVPARTLPPLQEAFARHRRDVRGVAESTIRRDLVIVQEFLQFLRSRRHTITKIPVADIDKFLGECGRRLVPKTLAGVACALRSFFRFLYTSGTIPHDLTNAVATPRVRRNDSPPRAIPWSDVRRILRAINRKTRTGRRDYALLLMMAVYGLGSGEARGLTPA